MNSKPILFSSEMVRAILEGRKTQTRRVMKPQPSDDFSPVAVEWYSPIVIDRHGEEQPGKEIFGVYSDEEGYRCPYGAPEDQLWIKEAWGVHERISCCKEDMPNCKCKDGVFRPVVHFAGKENHAWGMYGPPKKRSARFMPRTASRITLEIVKVRVERIKEITTQDCEAEGVGYDLNEIGWHYAFGQLWNKINEKRGFGWNVNPWVWVIEFKRVESK